MRATAPVCDSFDEQGYPTHHRGLLEAIAAVPPKTNPLRDVTRLVESIIVSGPLTVVRLLTAKQLTCVVVVDFYLEAGGSVAVVVSCYKVHVLARWRDNS